MQDWTAFLAHANQTKEGLATAAPPGRGSHGSETAEVAILNCVPSTRPQSLPHRPHKSYVQCLDYRQPIRPIALEWPGRQFPRLPGLPHLRASSPSSGTERPRGCDRTDGPDLRRRSRATARGCSHPHAERPALVPACYDAGCARRSFRWARGMPMNGSGCDACSATQAVVPASRSPRRRLFGSPTSPRRSGGEVLPYRVGGPCGFLAALVGSFSNRIFTICSYNARARLQPGTSTPMRTPAHQHRPNSFDTGGTFTAHLPSICTGRSKRSCRPARPTGGPTWMKTGNRRKNCSARSTPATQPRRSLPPSRLAQRGPRWTISPAQPGPASPMRRRSAYTAAPSQPGAPVPRLCAHCTASPEAGRRPQAGRRTQAGTGCRPAAA